MIIPNYEYNIRYNPSFDHGNPWHIPRPTPRRPGLLGADEASSDTLLEDLVVNEPGAVYPGVKGCNSLPTGKLEIADVVIYLW